MRRIVIDMGNYLFADAIAQALQNTDSDFDVYRVEKPEDTIDYCQLAKPYALLMEVTGNAPFQLKNRLRIREAVIRQDPNCKIVLIVDEKADKKLADDVRQAKKDGLIDQFIYGSISASYLTALIDAL